MSEEQRSTGKGDQMTPDDAVPTEKDGARHITFDELRERAGRGSEMTFNEMQKAIEDASHPLHEEALRQNKELAAKVVPALQSLQKQVAAQLNSSGVFKGVKIRTAQDPGITGIKDSAAKDIGTVVSPKVDWSSKLPKPVALPGPVEAVGQQQFDEMAESVAEAAREREERAERQVEMAAAQLTTLEAMAANLQQLNQQMERVDGRLGESNKAARVSFGWTLTVGLLTLLATILGVVLSWNLSGL